jgi:hypothetical protein
LPIIGAGFAAFSVWDSVICAKPETERIVITASAASEVIAGKNFLLLLFGKDAACIGFHDIFLSFAYVYSYISIRL